jgi:hypothetical protein
MALRERGYNRGLVTGVALMGVHAASGARAIHRSGRLGRGEALGAAVVGIGLRAFLPVAMKRRMCRAAKGG